MIQLTRLEGFYWVGRAGGFSAAARAMPYPITQPAVYQQVRKLEIELELKLFERVGRGDMRLTPPGRKLYDFVRPFFEGLPGVVRAIQSDEYGGTIRISAANKFIVELLPDWIATLREDRPDIRIELTEAVHPDTSVLDDSQTDLIVDHFPEGVPDGYGSQLVGMTYGCFVIPAQIAARLDLSKDLQVLNDIPFIGYKTELIHYSLQASALKRFGLTPHHAAQVERADAILALVKAGLGFSMIGAMSPDGPDEESIFSFRPPDGAIDFPVHAVWRESGPAHPLVKVMLDYIDYEP